MKILKSMRMYLLFIALDFYLVPGLIRDTGTAVLILLVVIPFLCFLCSVFYGANHSFHWQYGVITALLFIPSIFLYYNSSAWVYIIGYGVIAFIGNLIGMIFYKLRGDRI
ncbi:hypothetical protein GPL15_08620 [Clostridium sp. MCC353]|uniref:hypothetical protein n=1 Tax=Clostridium sp. MCC353 TaxID=2592646 RepID=UPI001C02B03F|nr:hypothetical protein [Clostridium sp. MCC353]MBT9776566.1 hypothetical protein [Clostridium sp. MCC353]